MKHFGPIVVLDYGVGERKLKIELSTRCYNNHYEVKGLAGTEITILKEADMFAHKLCALLDRKGMAGRDVFDIHFFLEKGTAINPTIVEQRMKKQLNLYIGDCISALQKVDPKKLMENVGELLEGTYKNDMRSGKLVDHTIELLNFYKLSPILENYPENSMPISAVYITNSKEGKSVLNAIVGDKHYNERLLTVQETKCLNAYPEQEDKNNFLLDLARRSYFRYWLNDKDKKVERKKFIRR